MDLLTIIGGLVCGAACFYLSKDRKRNPWLWLLLGLVFNFTAVIFLLILPEGDLEDQVLQLKARVRVLEEGKHADGGPALKLGAERNI